MDDLRPGKRSLLWGPPALPWLHWAHSHMYLWRSNGVGAPRLVSGSSRAGAGTTARARAKFHTRGQRHLAKMGTALGKSLCAEARNFQRGNITTFLDLDTFLCVEKVGNAVVGWGHRGFAIDVLGMSQGRWKTERRRAAGPWPGRHRSREWMGLCFAQHSEAQRRAVAPKLRVCMTCSYFVRFLSAASRSVFYHIITIIKFEWLGATKCLSEVVPLHHLAFLGLVDAGKKPQTWHLNQWLFHPMVPVASGPPKFTVAGTGRFDTTTWLCPKYHIYPNRIYIPTICYGFSHGKQRRK